MEERRQTASMIKVTVAQMMGDVKEIEVLEGTTVREAINKADMSTKNLTDVRMNTAPVNLDAVLEPDAIVTLVPTVEGGC